MSGLWTLPPLPLKLGYRRDTQVSHALHYLRAVELGQKNFIKDLKWGAENCTKRGECESRCPYQSPVPSIPTKGSDKPKVLATIIRLFICAGAEWRLRKLEVLNALNIVYSQVYTNNRWRSSFKD
jgi:hypothetical protein